MVLVMLPLVVGVLDAEVCGEEEGAEFGNKLLLRVLGASEVRVAAAIEGGGVTGGMGHLMQQHAGERLIGKEGLARGDEDAVGAGGVTGAPLIAHGFHDGAAGGEDEVARDGGGAVAHMLRYRWGGDALDFACVEDVPVADAAQVVAGDFLFTRILVLLLDGELAPFLDERCFGPLFEVPAAIANLVECAPAVVREPSHVAHETEVETVAALIHRA